MFQPLLWLPETSSEVVCLLPLPVLATMVMRRDKKLVIRVAECVAALIPRAATHSATCTTNFLPRHITIVARTGRGSKQTSSEEGLW